MVTRDPARTARLFKLIAERLREKGMTAAEASRTAGLQQDAIRNLERGSVPNSDTLISLARTLDLPAATMLAALELDLRGQERDIPGTVHPVSTTMTGKSVDPAAANGGDTDGAKMPLYRYAAQADGTGTDKVVTHIDRPHELRGRGNAYGAYIEDDANAPIIRAGHVVYVDPSRPYANGHFVRVIRRSGAPVVGVLDSRDGSQVVLMRAAAGQLALPVDTVLRIERVTGFSFIDG